LGYRKTVKILEHQKKIIDKIIYDGFSRCSPKGVYEKLSITGINHNKVNLENKLVLKGYAIVKFLKKCCGVFLIAVTAGNEIVDYRDKLISEENINASAILDAVGSEVVEEYAERLHHMLDTLIIKTGYTVTKNRFSPGYGDLNLDIQKKFCDLLDAEKIGISVSKSYILIPEKSITAIIGIKERE